MRRFYTSTFILCLSAGFPHITTAQSAYDPISCATPYTVASGDTLGSIHMRAYGIPGYGELHIANLAVIGRNPDIIRIGQRLLIPCASSTKTAAMTPTTTTETAPLDASDAELELASAMIEDDNLVFTFNKTSAPKFIINSGIIDLYLEEISQATDGRVTFIDPPEMSRNAMNQLALVEAGEVDGTYIFNGYLADSHPHLQLPMYPLMGGSAEQTAVSLWRLHDEYLSDTDYFNQAKLLGFVAAPAAHVWRLSDEPVTLEEGISTKNDYAVPYFEGLDTRGPPAVQEENKAMLADYNEAKNGAMTFFLAHGAARAAGLWNEDRTVTEVDNGMYTPTFSVVLSNDAWAQISTEDQDAILEISGEHLARRSASWDAFDNGHRRHMLDTGLNVVKADRDLLDALQRVTAVKSAPWIEAVNAFGVPAMAAMGDYLADLNAMQDLLIYR